MKLLFSKLPNTIYYLQYGEDEPKSKPRYPRAAVELEVKPGRSREEQIAVVVAALLDEEQSEALDSVKVVINNAISEIRAWETLRIASPNGESIDSFNLIDRVRPPICSICT